MKIALILGARPQFIKAAPLHRELKKSHRLTIIHTGQHYDHNMSALFFREMKLPEPDVNLGIGSGPHGCQTGQMLTAIESALLEYKPALVIVFGDTNSTLAGALASAKLHLPVAHVEAGLRSFNKKMPEEINRVMTDHISNLLFCPTQTAVDNLAREGIPLYTSKVIASAAKQSQDITPEVIESTSASLSTGSAKQSQIFSSQHVFLTGDVMYDSLIFYQPLANKKSKLLNKLALTKEEYYLLTLHRAGNVDSPDILRRIFKALSSLAVPVVFPAHPRTKKMLRRGRIKPAQNIRVIDPVGYLEMICLEMNAGKILTDSGGVQKEAYILGIPCVTLRDETEWVETVEAGWNILVGTDRKKILAAANNFNPTSPRPPLFGDGTASQHISRAIGSIEF